MHIVGCQIDIAWEDKQATHDRVRRLLDKSAPPPGSAIVLPEMFATGFSMEVGRIHESTDGPTHHFLGELATQYRSAVIAGVVTRTQDGKGMNEAVIVSAEGKVASRYVKMHPFFATEAHYYTPGSALCVTKMDDAVVSPLICYDLRFPEAFRQATRMGAEVFIVIANWPASRQAHWSALLRARAIENQAYVVGINRVGSDPAEHYIGGSAIIDPRGDTIAEVDGGECLLAATLDLASLREYRVRFPVLDDIRDDLFPPMR